jgi:hypothetical protein
LENTLYDLIVEEASAEPIYVNILINDNPYDADIFDGDEKYLVSYSMIGDINIRE